MVKSLVFTSIYILQYVNYFEYNTAMLHKNRLKLRIYVETENMTFNVEKCSTIVTKRTLIS